MLLKAAFVLAVATLTPVVATIISPHIRHECRRDLPPGWRPVRRASSFAIPLRIGLVQNNLDQLQSFLLDVSHPHSPNYGKHWSPSKVASTFRPSSRSASVVREWLVSEGIHEDRIRLSKNGGWLQMEVSVDEAESLLRTSYIVYEHEGGVQHIACADGYYVPEHVTRHIELITPTADFDAKLAKRSPQPQYGSAKHVGQPGEGPVMPKSGGVIKAVVDQLGNCDQYITPACLRALYGFQYTPVSTKKNSIGIVEYTPQAYVASDLDLFFKNFSQTQVKQRPTTISIDGGFVQTFQASFDLNVESNLDLQYAMSLVGKSQAVTLYQVGDDVQGASFNNFLDALDGSYCTFQGGIDPTQDGVYPDPLGGYQGPEDCGITKPTNVISTSYGYNEADLSPSYTARQCSEYAKLGLMGVSVLYSSGDAGVAGNHKLCLNPNGTQTTNGTVFNPSFPSTCPYVTSIGATQIVSGRSVSDPESACMQNIFSGGGFSNYFGIPDYQKSLVQQYLAQHPPSFAGDIWNSTGISRAYPDISVNGANYAVAVNGQWTKVSGTSASAPVFAAFLTAINDARIAARKAPVGFINPVLYASTFQGAFNDIVNGSNPGCGTDGFSAAPGWDPVTGLGTPNFPVMLKKWLSLP